MNPVAQAIKEKMEWEKSMSIGTLDNLAAILNGEKLDYDAMDTIGGMKPEEHHMEIDDTLIKMAGVNLQVKGDDIKAVNITAISDSPNHLKAIEKYPSLIEMLGRDDTGQLADKIACVVNEWIVGNIGKNSQHINKNALDCKQENNFIKQYFKYDDRAGFIKVSGSFRGDEYIHYEPQENKAVVLRHKKDNKYDNVTKDFSAECFFVEIDSA